MNKIIIGKEKDGYYPKKDLSFNILSLANHLYYSWSIILESPQLGKIYLLLNLVLNLFAKKIKVLFDNIEIYNESFKKKLKFLAL